MSPRNGRAPSHKEPRRVATPRNSAPGGEQCPRCGRSNARVIGRSETLPVMYLRCDECHQVSVAPAA